MNGVSVCLDEIALEGLDGITLSTLWRRLDNVTPCLASALDKSYKEFLWRKILTHDVETFVLQEPRRKLDIFGDDTEIYPFCLIGGQENGGIRGSCSTFHSRKQVDVSKESLDVVEQTYGERLVLVASQVMREGVLFPAEVDLSVEISDICYCFLEWVGRARNLGRVQCYSTAFFDLAKTPRSAFHYIKILHRRQMITKQSVSIGGNAQPNVTCVLYLNKFHVDLVSDNLAAAICNFIEQRPGKSASVEDLFTWLCVSKQSILKSLSLLLKLGNIKSNTGVVRSTDISTPVLGHEEVPSDSHCDGFLLIKPFYSRLNVEDISIDENDEEDDDDDDDEEEGMYTSSSGEFPLKIPADLPVLHHIYQLIASKGLAGISLAECHKSVGFPWNDVRVVLRHLEQSQKVTVIFQNKGRQRISRYIASNIFKENLKPVKKMDPLPKENQSATAEFCQTETMDTGSIQGNDVISTSINIMETTKKEHHKSSGFTEKFQRRRKLVTDFLAEHRLAVGGFIIRKFILEREAEAGQIEKMDRKTFSRFLTKLKDNGTIQMFKVEVDLDGIKRTLDFICDANMKEDSPEVLGQISTYKEKALGEMRVKEALKDKMNEREVTAYASKLGYLPKMPRAEMLHIFLYIVIYEVAKPDVSMEALRKRLDWVEHLSPSCHLKEYNEGWFSAYSVLLLLPLSLFVKLISLSYEVPLLEEYLQNPVTRHMLIKDLPKDLSCHLTDERQILPSLLDILAVLASMNLIIPTGRCSFNHPKDVLCYLKKKAIQLDTKASLPGYREVTHPAGNKFPEIIHTFSSLADVTSYWFSLRDICLSTRLGHKAEKKSTVPVERTYKPNLKDYIREEEAALSEEYKPLGDGKGAAGLDSAIFSHYKRNWASVSLDTCKKESSKSFATTTVSAKAVSKHTGGKGVKRKSTTPASNEMPKKKIQRSQARAQQDKTSTQNSPASTAPSTVQKRQKSISKREKSIRTEKVKKIKRRAMAAVKRAHWSKKSHDKRDLEAQKRNEMQRVTFTPQEQKLLFICTLALRILGKKSTDTGYKDWLWTRDILYKDDFEAAKVKTALCISRKYRSMMSDPQTKVNLNICTSDCKLEKEFQPFCNLGKDCDEPTFVELVELLKKKYSMETMKTTPLFLPHNLKEFQRKYVNHSNLQPSSSKSVKTDEDIVSLKPPVASIADVRQGILRDSIFSTLLLTDEKYDPSAAYVFLDQFTEEELSLAISNLKKNKMVVRALLRHGQGRKLALNTFSQTISTTAQRILYGDFSPAVTQGAISFYNQLKENGSDLQGSVASVATEEANKTSESAFIAVPEDLHGGAVAGILTLLSTGQLRVKIEFPGNILRIDVGQEGTTTETTPADGCSTSKATAIQDDEEVVVARNENSVLTQEADRTAKDVNEDVLTTPKARQPVGKSSAPTRPLLNILTKDIHEKTRSLTEHGNSPLPINQVKPSSTQISRDKDQAAPRTLHVPKIVTTRRNVPKNYHTVQNTFADVLCGIEDHLFGSCGQAQNKPNYKVELMSKPTFSCCFTTTDVNVIAKTGENGLRAQERVAAFSNNGFNEYNEKVLPIRMVGTFIRPHIVSNPCIVKLSLSCSSAKKQSQTKCAESMELVDEYFKENAAVLPKNLIDCLRICSKEFHFADKDCEAVQAVYKCIENGKEIGVTKSELGKMVTDSCDLSNFSLNGLIKVLESFGLVYEVGFTEACYVTHAYRGHWALPLPCFLHSSTADQSNTSAGGKSHSTPVTGSGMDHINDGSSSDSKSQSESLTHSDTEERCVSAGTQTQQCSPITRPWLTMEGQINKSGYNTFHESVLRYILRYPGIDKFTITKHFVNIIFPVTLDSILKTLEDAHCILKRVALKKHRRNLFCKTNIAVHGTVTYFLPTTNAITKLADNVYL